MSDLFNLGYEDLIREAQNAPMKTIRLLSYSVELEPLRRHWTTATSPMSW